MGISHRQLLKKLEKMYPPMKYIEHRQGACMFERMYEHFAMRPITTFNDCNFENCWAKGDKKLWADDEWCDQYNDDCVKCQTSRGLEYKETGIPFFGG